MKLNDEEIALVWEQFRLNKNDQRIKNRLILHYIWLVKYIQKGLSIPSNSLLSNEDYTNIGILGLSEAIDRFEFDRGAKFESYALPRIKGTIQDELRKLDWLSRSTRKKANEFSNANDELRLQEGREVSQEEIRKKLNVTISQYESYLAAAAAVKASYSLSDSHMVFQDNEEVDLIESYSDDDDIDSLSTMVNTERLDYLTRFLSKLNEKKRLIMTLYYYEELTFKEIGIVMNVTESRICQIHTEVIGELRHKLVELEYA